MPDPPRAAGRNPGVSLRARIPHVGSGTRRRLASAALAASLLAADVVLIALILNPGVGLVGEAIPLLGALFLPWFVALSGLYLLLLVLIGVWRSPLSSARPPVEGLPWYPLLAWISVTGAALLFSYNLLGYRDSIPVASVHALQGSALALALASLALVGVGGHALLFPWRRRGTTGAVTVLASAVALVVPLALRPEPVRAADPVPLSTESVAPRRRVTLVGVDGIGARQLREGMAGGRLPEFGALLERGSFVPLATLQPALGPPVWTSIATGRWPRDHGVKSFVTYRLLGGRAVYELLPRGSGVRTLERAGLVSSAPVTAASRRSPALWTALNAFGIQTGVVRFWGTHPPEPVQGFMLSNYFHLLRSDPARVRSTLFPPDLAAEVAARGVSPADVEGAVVSDFLDTDPPAPPGGERWERELVERALAPDLTYRRAAEVLRSAYDPPFFAIYFYGADVVGHAFTRFARPEDFGGVSAASARRYGHVVDRYTAFLGAWIGEQAAALGPDDVLLVVSGYGMEAVSPWRRLVSAATGAPDASGTHSGGPPGFLIAVGSGVRSGAVLEPASVLDVAPTVLHLMGLPVARDMDGHVITGILDPVVAARQPVTYIPSYASLAVTALTADPAADLPPLMDDRP